jgi:hypothetical protein
VLDIARSFIPGRTQAELLELRDGDAAVASRLWRIDSLEGGREFPLATLAPPEQLAWLAAEADTLIESVPREGERLPRCA